MLLSLSWVICLITTLVYLIPLSGADPGEVKWVNFYLPFSEPPSFFFFFLSLKYWNNIWFLWFLWLRWRMCISDDRFYQSIYSFWAHKHLNQALFLLHYYKNSPAISKSWIRTCLSAYLWQRWCRTIIICTLFDSLAYNTCGYFASCVVFFRALQGLGKIRAMSKMSTRIIC